MGEKGTDFPDMQGSNQSELAGWSCGRRKVRMDGNTGSGHSRPSLADMAKNGGVDIHT